MGFRFVARFSQNNTFRPQLAVTREQLVSLVLESWKGIQDANITFPSNVSIRPYSDLPISRWSTGKVLFARDKKIVSGYQDGTFKPTQPVTRAEYIGVLAIAAEFGWSARGIQPNLVAKKPSKTFLNTQNYWAASIINQLSAYCSVAAAINEIGNRYVFDDSAKQNYAAATLRRLKSVKAK
ncbi:S-layer homology domain-containing protein [Microcoleus sp. S13_C5]|uniref:S-layer homology domain-containing protein n=1 Tax=Microcoleus sp. S13_C5 TaxID=3055411 RepID=UPI00403F902E